jgi:hypothetical protein
MKTIMIAAIAFAGVSAWASPNFETQKQKSLTMLDERIAALQEAKSCTTNATEAEQLRTCHKGLKEDHLAKREEHMKNKEGRLLQKAQKIKERREKMESKKTEATPEATEPTTGG